MGGDAEQGGRKVYLVWTGCYSDATVRAVYDDKDRAEQAAEAYRGCGLSGYYSFDDARVEEMPLNAGPQALLPRMVAAIAEMPANNGPLVQDHTEWLGDDAMVFADPTLDCIVREADGDGNGGDFVHVLSFVSAEHARKVCVDRWAARMAKRAMLGEPIKLDRPK